MNKSDKQEEVARTAEQRLSVLAADLATPIRDDPYLRAVLALGYRGRSLFLAFTSTIEGPTPSAAMSLIRPLVEINIVLRFLREDPKLHVELWEAEGDRQILAFFNDPRHQHAPSGSAINPLPTTVRARLEKSVAEARANAISAGVADISGRGEVFPAISSIVDHLDDPAAKQGYVWAYRTLGWNVHSGYHAFGVGGFTRLAGGRVSYNDESTRSDYLAARTLVITVFSSTLCIVSTEIGLQIHEEADQINRLFVTVEGQPPGAQDRSQTGSTAS